jgi:branched-chain amino acid transport system ATP-binding protein
MENAALQIRDLSMSFGAVQVIDRLNLEVARGARHAIIGPNGAGKTTLFNIVTGWLRPTAGEVWLDGKRMDSLTPQSVVRSGFSRSFQRNMLLEGLTVLENLRLACQAFSAARWNPIRSAGSFPDLDEAARHAARQLDLEDVLLRPVRELSYGQKRQLEVAIALCPRPKVLLMDEPAAGTSPAERKKLISLIRSLPSSLTLLLVEHDMDIVFELCERITVLSYGQVLASGTADEIRANPAVREAYLGKANHHARA